MSVTIRRGRQPLPLQQPHEQAARRALVAAALQDLVEHRAVLIHGAPQPIDPAANDDAHLVEVPDVARTRRPPAQLVGEGRAELHAPPAHGLIGHVDAPLEQHLLDHAQAEREAGVEPDGVGDDVAREAMPAVQDAGRHDGQRLRVVAAHGNRQSVNVTSPVEAREAETAALRALLEERQRGPFVGMQEGRRRTEAMLARKRRELGLPG